MSHDWLNRKKHFRLFSVQDPKSISLSERIVYSFLAYRDRIGKPASQSEIADECGLDRSKTVGNAVTKLLGRGLVQRLDSGLIALPPTGERLQWFYSLDNQGKHWSQRLGYVWYRPAKSGLTTTQNYLLWVLRSLGGTPQNKSGLAELTGLKRDTVVSSIKALVATGAITFEPLRGHRFRSLLKSPDPNWFLDKHSAVVSPQEKDLRDKLSAVGIPTYQIGPFVEDLLKLPDPVGFLYRVAKPHDAWIAKNGLSPNVHCGRILRIKLDKALKKGKYHDND